MDQSEAFKAARAKWGNNGLHVGQASTSAAGNPMVTQEGASNPSAGTIALSGHELSRMARAMETIAEHMPGILAALTSVGPAPAPSAPVLHVPVVDQGPTVPGVAQAAVPGPSSAPVAVPGPSSAPVAVPGPSSAPVVAGPKSAPVVAPGPKSASVVAPGPPSAQGPSGLDPADDEDFDYGLGQLFSDSDDDTNDEDRCGVCKQNCSKLIIALDCGHYPFCSGCVDKMTKKSATVEYKFLCPYCKQPVKEMQVVRIV